MRAIEEDNREACIKALIAGGADLNYETKVGVECVQEGGAPVTFMVGV